LKRAAERTVRTVASRYYQGSRRPEMRKNFFAARRFAPEPTNSSAG